MTRMAGIVITLVSMVLTGCAAIGPTTIPRDRFDYSTAVSDSWKRVMLLNVVKLRYADTPIFLEVSSIVNQYALEGELDAGAGFNSGGGILGDSITVGGRARYSDRPTITYSPLVGRKFMESLLTPIPPDGFFSLVQAGWPIHIMFRLCVSAINGIYNGSARKLFHREEDPEFGRLLKALERIQKSGSLGMRIVRKKGEKKSVLFFRRKLSDSLVKDVDTVRELLGLDPKAQKFSLEYGAIAKDSGEIAILTRSMLDITAELAAYVDIPLKHIAENRAIPGTFDMEKDVDELNVRARIRSSIEEPTDAFVAVRYRDHWFYIDDRAYRSKRVFSFLLFLFTLAETGAPDKAPVLTIPTN